jgi:hypothetical protein
MNTKIYVNKLGNVKKSFVEKILKELDNFYNLLASKGIKVPYVVDLVFYENSEKALNFLEREALDRGINVVSLYPVMHEAWRGIPRIHVIIEAINDLDWKTLKSLIIHEAAHSVLHSNVKYYILALDPNLLDDPSLASLASAVIKDIDVINFLKSLNLVEEINAYIDYVINELKSLKCSDKRSLLELAKLLVPILFITRPIEEAVDVSCKRYVPKILKILNEVINEKGDLDKRVNSLLRRLSEVINEV